MTQNEWQDIESAPTKEEFIHVVLIARDRGKRAVMPCIFDGDEWCAVTIAGLMPFRSPTHWMPLPPPPESKP